MIITVHTFITLFKYTTNKYNQISITVHTFITLLSVSVAPTSQIRAYVMLVLPDCRKLNSSSLG
jgi:hypothetical protein